jgi:pyruvate-formate lyase-activating enzyme
LWSWNPVTGCLHDCPYCYARDIANRFYRELPERKIVGHLIPNTNIIRWAQSKYGFYVDRHYHGRQWLIQPGPIRLAPYHARILAHCFTPDDAGRLPYDVIAWCEPAKSGKSAMTGLVAEYMALHGDRNSTRLNSVRMVPGI